MPVLSFEKRKEAAIYRAHFDDKDRTHYEDHHATADELQAVRVARVLRPVGVWVSDADLCELAAKRADYLIDWIVELRGPLDVDTLNDKMRSLEARPFEVDNSAKGKPLDVQLQGFVKRATCQLFWRRQLRRAQVQKREAQEQAAGHISARKMAYCHDVTEARYLQRQLANRAMLEATEIESAEGEILTLWAAAQAGTANKSIRRGELMTRIRGCEEWATAQGMVGIFTTNTLPSRFHASLFAGGKNPNFDGSTPRDGQSWLSSTWARARAKIQRVGLKVFGFRVAEPHHDGCPHWHMLLWCSAEQVGQLRELLRAAWLQQEGEEYGAQQYRFKAEAIDPARGGAVAYLAKYIAKNIDDTGSVGEEGHTDHEGQQEINLGSNKARRVTAWASAWRIRQFQAIGQPPVTVWRELRRVDAGDIAAASKRLQRAFDAVHKGEAHRADWAGYMTEQGGAMQGRAYQLKIEFDTEEIEGRYGATDTQRPAGVYDVARGPGELCLSKRSRWKQRGAWTPAERHTARIGAFAEVACVYLDFGNPWTRFNNYTQPNGGHPARQPNPGVHLGKSRDKNADSHISGSQKRSQRPSGSSRTDMERSGADRYGHFGEI